ncbi:MAG: hypothetical protein H6Q57_1140 [Geobacteraceae bacterium]|jgi:hypothetical protein|nr:hypothetical protein [Geobacteraceae bacterium]
MMKIMTGLLLIVYCLTIGAGIAKALDIQTAPMEQNNPSSTEKNKQYLNIGQRDPQKDNPQGVWLDFLLDKNMAVGCGLTVNFQEPEMQNDQNGNSVRLGLGEAHLGGCVGLKFLFK